MPAGDTQNFSRECIIRNSAEIIITENGEAVLYKVSDNSKFMTSNIFAARITEYVPQLRCCFADIGDHRRAFLSLDAQEELLPGSFVLAQITAARHDRKGARLTRKIRLTGVYIVLLPCDLEKTVYISSKIAHRGIRERLKGIGESLDAPFSLILRTEASAAPAGEIAAEYRILCKKWRGILEEFQKAVSSGNPSCLSRRDAIPAVLLQYPLKSYAAVSVDSPELLLELQEAFPEIRGRIQYLPQNIFAAKSVEYVREKLLGRVVKLRGGGNIVIDKTEAMTVVDVNSEQSHEPAASINLEAAWEIMRQLRLRDLGGIIICDFIDMEQKEDQERLLSEMRKLSKLDPSKPEIIDVTALGLVEITRKRS